MEIIYTAKALADKEYWKRISPVLFERLERLIADIQQHPFTGLEKPEPLKFAKSGYWSRRINHEHRLVYKIVNNRIYIIQCRYHY